MTRTLYEDRYGHGHTWWHMKSVMTIGRTRVDHFACVGCGAFTRGAMDAGKPVMAPMASYPCKNRERSLVELVMGS